MSYTIDTSDLRKLAADLATAGSRVGAATSKAVRESAERVKVDAARTAPRATGVLRRSIGVDTYGDGRSVGMTAVVGPAAFYGLYLERGTVKMSARPFMEPALEREAPAFEAAIAAVVDEAMQ